NLYLLLVLSRSTLPRSTLFPYTTLFRSLNKVRTSPDHGTAFEIAGKGVADESSFKAAVFKAIQIFHNRNEYLELTKNPLRKMPRSEEHTSELQSRENLVCRLLLEKKKKQ